MHVNTTLKLQQNGEGVLHHCPFLSLQATPSWEVTLTNANSDKNPSLIEQMRDFHKERKCGSLTTSPQGHMGGHREGKKYMYNVEMVMKLQQTGGVLNCCSFLLLQTVLHVSNDVTLINVNNDKISFSH